MKNIADSKTGSNANEPKAYNQADFTRNYRRFIQEMLNRLPSSERANIRLANKNQLAGFNLNSTNNKEDGKSPFVNFLAGINPDLSDDDFRSMTTGLLLSLQANLTNLSKQAPVLNSNFAGSITGKMAKGMTKVAPSIKIISKPDYDFHKSHFANKLWRNDDYLSALTLSHDFIHTLLENKGHLPSSFIARLTLRNHAMENPALARTIKANVLQDALHDKLLTTTSPQPSSKNVVIDNQYLASSGLHDVNSSRMEGYVQIIVCVATLLGSLLTSSSPNGGSVFGSIMSKLGFSDKQGGAELAKALEKQQIFYLTDPEGMRVKSFRDLVIKNGSPMVDKAVDAKLNEALFKTWYDVQKQYIADNKALSQIRDVLNVKQGEFYIAGLLDKDWFRNPQTFWDAFLDLAVKKSIKLDNQQAVKDTLFSGKSGLLDFRWTKKWEDIWDKFRSDNSKFFSETVQAFMTSLLAQADDLARFMIGYKGLELEYVITSPDSFLPKHSVISEFKKSVGTKYSTTNTAQQNIDLATGRKDKSPDEVLPVNPVTPVNPNNKNSPFFEPVLQPANNPEIFTPILQPSHNRNDGVQQTGGASYYVGNDGIYVTTSIDKNHNPVATFINLGNSVHQSKKSSSQSYPYNPFLGSADDYDHYEGFALAALATPLIKMATKKVVTSPMGQKMLGKVTTTLGSKLPFVKKIVGRVKETVGDKLSNSTAPSNSNLSVNTPTLDGVTNLIGKEDKSSQDIENILTLLTRDTATLMAEVKSASSALSGIDSKLTLLVSKLLTSAIKPVFRGSLDSSSNDLSSNSYYSPDAVAMVGAVLDMSNEEIMELAPVYLREQYS